MLNCSRRAGGVPALIRTALLAGVLPALFLTAEVQAQGMPSNMKNMPAMGDSKGEAKGAPATGTVDAVNAAERKIKLSHGPIPAISWPAMTMEFPAAASVDLSKVKPGDKVKFTLSGANGSYTVDSITPAE
jgi:Cu(I)/Ag(I) efflux system periplasmic protein CusF